MRTEQDVVKLAEVKWRMEKLIAYYRGKADREDAFLSLLETRLSRVSEALSGQA